MVDDGEGLAFGSPYRKSKRRTRRRQNGVFVANPSPWGVASLRSIPSVFVFVFVFVSGGGPREREAKGSRIPSGGRPWTVAGNRSGTSVSRMDHQGSEGEERTTHRSGWLRDALHDGCTRSEDGRSTAPCLPKKKEGPCSCVRRDAGFAQEEPPVLVRTSHQPFGFKERHSASHRRIVSFLSESNSSSITRVASDWLPCTCLRLGRRGQGWGSEETGTIRVEAWVRGSERGMGERATGELRELKDRLNRLHGVKSTKEVFQNKSVLFRRVIHLMVSGVDVSELFSSMVLASTPDEPALKKLLYLYICTHARSNPDLALMTINTLTVDCASEDATIRRSALRSLCSLGTPNLADYLVKPIQDGLTDRSVLVRRVAAVGVLKLHSINPELVENTELLDRLRALLYEEKDTQVLSNCMVVISKLEGREKLLEKGFVYTLLNNLNGFSVWGRSIALDIISSYRPSSEEEMYDIMNILEDHLASVNSAVVLAGVKVAFCMTTTLPAVHDRVLQRIKPPLLTIASSGYPGPQYIAFCHVVGLSGIEPALFSRDLTRLYCRDSDPTFVKQKKMMALVQVANEKNVYDIVTELKNYTHDVKKKTAVTAVSCIGQIALGNLAAAGVVECLLEYIIEGRIHVASAALVCARDVFRKYPDATIGWTEELINLDFQLLDSLESEIAGLWIMGEYPELFAEPALILENYVDRADQILDSKLKLQLLTTCNKLFFKSPASCNSIFQSLISTLLHDNNPLVQDQAFLHYRLMSQHRPLSQDIASLRIGEHLNVGNRMGDGFADKNQFNSLSVVCTPPSRVL